MAPLSLCILPSISNTGDCDEKLSSQLPTYLTQRGYLLGKSPFRGCIRCDVVRSAQLLCLSAMAKASVGPTSNTQKSLSERVLGMMK